MSRRRRSKNGSVEQDDPENEREQDEQDAPGVIQRVVVKPLAEQTAVFEIQGLTPYLQLRFSEKARIKMQETQQAGHRTRSKRERQPRNFAEDYEGSMYRTADEGHGIPAAA